MESNRPVILAAGGTGGHIFPAEALADELLSRGIKPILVTDQRFAGYFSSGYKGTLSQIETHTIRSGTVAGGLIRKVKGVGDIALGIAQATSLLK